MLEGYRLTIKVVLRHVQNPDHHLRVNSPITISHILDNGDVQRTAGIQHHG